MAHASSAAHSGRHRADGQTLSTSSATWWLESAFFLVLFLACRPLAAYAVRSGIVASFYDVLRRCQGCRAAPRTHSGSSPAQVRCPRGYHQPHQVSGGFRRSRPDGGRPYRHSQTAKALPTSANLLSSSQHGKKARFSLRRKPKWMQSHGHSASPSLICPQIGRASSKVLN